MLNSNHISPLSDFVIPRNEESLRRFLRQRDRRNLSNSTDLSK